MGALLKRGLWDVATFFTKDFIHAKFRASFYMIVSKYSNGVFELFCSDVVCYYIIRILLSMYFVKILIKGIER